MEKKANLKTPIGIIEITGDEHGISKLTILEDSLEISNDIPPVLASAIDQLKAYFEGSLQHFDLKLNPSGTNFQQQVWKEISAIKFGETCSYMELSNNIGNTKAIRAVAAANGKNPLWIIIPCHRVIGSDGSLTGYAGKLWRKKWLLDHENALPQLSLF